MTTDDAALAVRIAQHSGQQLLALRENFGPVAPDDKVRRKELRDLADRSSHVYLTDELAQFRPDDAVLSEEGVDETQRDSAQRVWIIDPLDGTSEYGQGRHDWAVHVALWDRARPTSSALAVGVVDLPAQGITLTSVDSERARTEVAKDRPVRIVVSRSRPPQLTQHGIEQLAKALSDDGVTTAGVEVLNVGSVGAKVAEVILDRADAYVHDTGFYEWDVAAPLAVAKNYGLSATHLDGSEVTFNHRPPWVTDLVVCVPQLTGYLTGTS